MAQMRALYKRTEAAAGTDGAVDAAYLSMLLDTILVFSPEIYENYRELEDMFRGRIRAVLAKTSNIDGALKDVLKRACDNDILLTEKYEEYYGS